MSLDHSAAYRRVFAPLPALDGKVDAESPVGQAWLDALTSDPAVRPRLVRARPYLRSTAVSEVSIGMVRQDPYRAGDFTTVTCVLADETFNAPSSWRPNGWGEVRVHVDLPCMATQHWRELTRIARALPVRWAQLTGAQIAERLIAEAERHGIPLLPESPARLYPTCGCAARSSPCKHASAALVQTARQLDHDPLALLLLRGRAASDFLGGVADPDHPSLKRAFRPGAPAELPQVSAGDAYRRRHPSARPPLPPVPVPGPPGAVKVGLTSLPGVDMDALTLLALRTARRAGGLLADFAAEADPARRPAIGGPRSETAADPVAHQAQHRLGIPSGTS
ncbi:hypothetical protein [Kitasatospora griseola]|uniref:hypothetical protein n=1 Tax=Kitasatospora griseola TaxID=2064 RepID=UPI003423288F